ncbi:MAG TPA: TorF family putative porin [Burkholderiaceae bacterium]|jgi:uncharacterized protein (TIGR02001 family)
MKSLLPLLLVSICTLAHAEGETPDHTLTANISVNSDYRFRGISQTWSLPAVQGGFDYANANGVYLGAWDSNVSGNVYNNGAGLEQDLYGGYKFDIAKGVGLDFGALAYLYPGARLNSAPGVASGNKYNNVDVYAALNAGAFSAKLSVAVTDYFGLNDKTAAYAYFSSLTAHSGSKGTSYLDLNYSFDLGNGLTLGAHAGRLTVQHYSALSYTDAKVSLGGSAAGLNWTVAAVATDAKKAYYQVADASGQRAKRTGKRTLVLSLGKSF